MSMKSSNLQSVKVLRRIKFLMVLPPIVLPFLIFLLWSIGIVGEVKGETNRQQNFQGLNLTLPSAAPSKDSNWNKLKYYEQADKVSVRLKSILKNDPYRKMEMDIDMPDKDTFDNDNHFPLTRSFRTKKDVNEERVYKKLSALDTELKSAADQDKKPIERKDNAKISVAVNSPDIDRLENMMQSMQKGSGEDPEVKQLNEMLEKILDIQNPQRLENKLLEQSEKNKRKVFTVHHKSEDIISGLETKRPWYEKLKDSLPDSAIFRVQHLVNNNRFYSLDEVNAEEGKQNAIPAVVHEFQTLVSKESVKLRLRQEVVINGIFIPKDQFIYGRAVLNDNRLYVTITSIQYNNNILPVSLNVYSTDGMKGIPIQNAMARDAMVRSGNQAAQNLSLSSLDPSWQAQATEEGIKAAKSLLSKKTKLIKVTLTAGYPVLLVDDNSEKVK